MSYLSLSLDIERRPFIDHLNALNTLMDRKAAGHDISGEVRAMASVRFGNTAADSSSAQTPRRRRGKTSVGFLLLACSNVLFVFNNLRYLVYSCVAIGGDCYHERGDAY